MIPETPAQVRALLAGRRLAPKRRRGQNFLADRNIRDAIVRAAGVVPGDLVLEVGPGLGTLTRGILDAGAEVVAAELDRGLLAFLEEALGEESRLDLVGGDALEGRDLAPAVRAALAARRPGARRRLLVSNLPYSAATPVIAAEARAEEPPDRMVVMVQKELADRMAARPGSPDYGPLSVLLALRGELRVLREVGGGVFVPPARVRSAVVEIVPRGTDHRELLLADRVARACFLHRRKTLRRTLREAGHGLERVEAVLESSGIDGGARPEVLFPKDFVRIALGFEELASTDPFDDPPSTG